MCLLGVSMMNNHLYGFKVPQNPHFGGLNKHFMPNMQKIQIAISSDLCIRLTWNLTGSCGQQQRLCGWSRMVVKQFQDGVQPPFWKSIYRHISVKNWTVSELSVYLDGQRLRHECHPTYLGMTLDCTLSYRVHLTKTAGKLKNRNNLLMKLAGSTWGASANNLRSSALALCYSAAEYCTPVWSRSAHTSQVDVQLNSNMHLISGTLRSTPLPWLPVLSNIEPPALRRKAATDKLVEKIVNMTVGQSSLISLTHHYYDWHPGSHCGWTCNQLTSKVDGGITGSRLRWSILT